MAYYQTKGLTLIRRDWGETDRLFVIYTRDYGKLEVLAKGGKKTKSKLASHLEPFLLSEILIAKGKSYDVLVGANSLYYFKNIWLDVFKTGLASYCLELINLLTQPAQPERAVYELLVKTLHQLDQSKTEDQVKSANLVRLFAWQLLNIAGYQPELHYCLACQSQIQAGQNYFDANKGGLVCANCRTEGLIALSDSAIKVLRLFLKKDIGDFTRLKIDGKLREEINQVVDGFVSAHLETKIQSLQFIKIGHEK
ncbi:MAG: DNA repair protein RecO [bacterium]